MPSFHSFVYFDDIIQKIDYWAACLLKNSRILFELKKTCCDTSPFTYRVRIIPI